MNNLPDWNGSALMAALTEKPSRTLSFYSYGVMLRKTARHLLCGLAVGTGDMLSLPRASLFAA